MEGVRPAEREEELQKLRRHGHAGRPLGDETFLAQSGGNDRARPQAPEAR